MSWTTIGIQVALIATVPYVTFKRLSTAPAVRCTINTAQPNYARSITWACTPVYTSDVALNRDRTVVPALRDTRSFPNTYHRLAFALLYNLYPLSSIFLLFMLPFPLSSRSYISTVSRTRFFFSFVSPFYLFILLFSAPLISFLLFLLCLIIPVLYLVLFWLVVLYLFPTTRYPLTLLLNFAYFPSSFVPSHFHLTVFSNSTIFPVLYPLQPSSC